MEILLLQFSRTLILRWSNQEKTWWSKRWWKAFIFSKAWAIQSEMLNLLEFPFLKYFKLPLLHNLLRQLKRLKYFFSPRLFYVICLSAVTKKKDCTLHPVILNHILNLDYLQEAASQIKQWKTITLHPLTPHVLLYTMAVLYAVCLYSMVGWPQPCPFLFLLLCISLSVSWLWWKCLLVFFPLLKIEPPFRKKNKNKKSTDNILF